MNQELKKRGLYGMLYVLVLVLGLFLHPLSFLLLVLLACWLAIKEFGQMVELSSKDVIFLAVLGFLLILLEWSLLFFKFGANYVMALAFLVVSFYPVWGLFRKKTLIDRFGRVLVGVFYIIIPMVLLLKLAFFKGFYTPNLVFSLFLFIWISDTFAYLVGKRWGKHKLFPSISPKKTIEGFLGGLLGCVFFSYPIYFFLLIDVMSFPIAFSLTFMIPFLSSIGDLVESKYKRDAKIKDTGALLPGHGGILDRLDSLIFAIPFVYMLLHFIFVIKP